MCVHVCVCVCVSVSVCVCCDHWLKRSSPFQFAVSFNSDVRCVVGIISANSSHTVKLNIMLEEPDPF